MIRMEVVGDRSFQLGNVSRGTMSDALPIFCTQIFIEGPQVHNGVALELAVARAGARADERAAERAVAQADELVAAQVGT